MNGLGLKTLTKYEAKRSFRLLNPNCILLQYHPIGSVIFWDNLHLTQKAAQKFTPAFTKLTLYVGKINEKITASNTFCSSFTS